VPLVPPAARGRVDATVFVPAYNGETYLERLLTAVEEQDFEGRCEVLVIDSGSTDKTLQIVAEHPLVRLVEIPQSEFGHGKTRNLAARLARGKKIAFLSHDAVPISPQWLRELLAPVGESDCRVAYGRQIARSRCFPSLKYEIGGVFAAGDSGNAVTLVRAPNGDLSGLTEAELFHSDVNAASLTSFITDEIPFRDVSYSEDLAFARDVLSAGYAKAYVPAAAVEHSNDVTLADYGKRVFDETLGRKRAGHDEQTLSWLGMLARLARDISRTSGRIIRDPDYGFGATVRWLCLNPAYLIKKWINIRRAQLTGLSDESRIARYSLEHTLKAN
jgi:rhamnosyltransferase